MPTTPMGTPPPMPLPPVSMSGSNAEDGRASAVDGELHVGLVDDEHGARGTARPLLSEATNSGVGSTSPQLVRADSTGRLRRRHAPVEPERLGVVVREDVGGLRGRGVETGEVAFHAAVVAARPQGLVEVAVVLAVEHQHRGPAGRHTSDADRVGVRPGRRQGELPLRKAEALGEQPAHLDGVGGREQEVVAEECLVVDRRARSAPGRSRPASRGRRR